jgi:hypothetical protein
MITFRVTTDVKDDRRVILTLPPEVQIGRAELVVTVESPPPESKHPQTSLPDWAEVQAARNGKERYPLRGSVVRYEQPTVPVGDADWEALQ